MFFRSRKPKKQGEQANTPVVAAAETAKNRSPAQDKASLPVGSSSEGMPPSSRAKLAATAFGEIISVMVRSERHKHYSLADLEWLVLPAVRSNQFSIAVAEQKGNEPIQPVAVALWARVSKDVDAKLSAITDKPIRLRPEEWCGGEIYWIVEIVGSPPACRQLIDKLAKTVFNGRHIKLRVRGKNGQMAVSTIRSA